MDSFALLTAQINPVVGDINGNVERILSAWQQAQTEAADLVVYPELAISGYPPEDLVHRQDFLQSIKDAVLSIAQKTKDGADILLGLPWAEDDKCYNAVALIEGGELTDIRFKHALPNYGVFDEKRNFNAGPLTEPIEWRGVKIGVPVCEDWWVKGSCQHFARNGAEILISINASPFRAGVTDERDDLIKTRIKETGLPFVFCNIVGGQDELVFDGRSCAFNANSKRIQALNAFQEHLSISHWKKGKKGWVGKSDDNAAPLKREAEIYAAMKLGLRNYVDKTGFPGVILGLSGGVDSALSAVVAVDALGADRVQAVMMPSPYTSDDSINDAEKIANNLGIQLHSIDISNITDSFQESLTDVLDQEPEGVTAENLQSRARGMLLMALSNATGYMVLTTGNKSEIAVGYATLYGDMCGGYNALKDLYKTQVYHMSAWRNKQSKPAPIPKRVLTRAPSAELRPDQTDQDSLPSYEVLDAILMGLVDRQCTLQDLVAEGHNPNTAQEIQSLLRKSEYKRRQAAPGAKLGPRAFGRDWRYPLVNRFQGTLSS